MNQRHLQRNRQISLFCICVAIPAIITLGVAFGQSSGGMASRGRMIMPPAKEEMLWNSACASFPLPSSPFVSSACAAIGKAVHEHQWDEARKLARELVESQPESGLGYLGLGYIESKSGDPIAAIRYLQNAVDKSPEVPLAHLDLGLGYAALQQFKLFEDEMQWLVRQVPSDPVPFLLLGRYYAETLQRFEEASDFFRQAIARNPKDWKPKYHLGWIYESTGDLERARTEYELAAATTSEGGNNSAYPLEGLARIHLQQQKPAEAIRYALQAVTLDPGLVSSHIILGNIYLQTKEFTKGIEELKIAAKLDPTDPAPHYMLARAYMRIKRSSEAQKEEETFKQLHDAYGER
jgi:tetratricopeptide (TPR) repeat protein